MSRVNFLGGHPTAPPFITATMPRRSTRVSPSSLSTDAILPMQVPYMGQIIDGLKNYEFRKYRLKPNVKRIWVYRTAPHSSITHVCEILRAHTRDSGDPPLTEDGLGNSEFNTRHKDWNGYDFAYKIVSVFELRQQIPLLELRGRHGFKSASRGIVYLPKSIAQQVSWDQQKLVSSLLRLSTL